MCRKYNKKIHYAKVCRSKPVQVVQESDGEYLGAVMMRKSHCYNTTIAVDNVEISFRIDTVAMVDVIPGSMYRSKFKDKVLFPLDKSLYGADRKTLRVIGYINATL